MPEDTSHIRNEYDYIVVGSGAGGGPVAAALAKSGHKVLLLEAGGDEEPPTYPVPAFHALASEDPKLSWDFFVRHYADDKRSRDDPKFVTAEDGVFYPRSGTLGGCTAHHALVTLAPNDSDWDAIARETGDDTWSADNMRLYFKRLEKKRYRGWTELLYRLTGINHGQHGYFGWLPIEMASPKLVLDSPRLRRIVISAALGAQRQDMPWLRGLLARLVSLATHLRDVNGRFRGRPNQEGVRLVPVSTLRGQRRGTRELLRHTAQSFPDNLTIALNALATNILFETGANGKPRAVGVRYLSGPRLFDAPPEGQMRPDPQNIVEARCRAEVILCAGAFNTPKLLMLSGIGPKDELKRHGIDVLLDRPGVGRNLQDRYEVGVVSRMKQPFKLLTGAKFRPPEPGEEPGPLYRRWLRRKGPYTTNGAVLSIVRKSDPGLPEPDLFCFGLIGGFKGYYPGYSKDATEHPEFTWAILKAHTTNSAGRVTLRSDDARDAPEINFHYFDEGNGDHQKDLGAVVDGVKYVRALNNDFADLIENETVPGSAVETDAALEDFVRNQAWGHHASCTCKIGRPDDNDAVIDSAFRVIGTERLRIADASVFPNIPGFFIVTPIYMIAEKCADMIVTEARAKARGEA